MAPATIILIILVALIMFGAGGCMLCVCVGAASGNSPARPLDSPGPDGLVCTTAVPDPLPTARGLD